MKWTFARKSTTQILGSSLLSPDSVCDAGLYVGVKYCSADEVGLDSEEEEKSRQENDPKFSERTDSLLNLLPKMNVVDNNSVGKDDKKLAMDASDHAKIKPGPAKGEENRRRAPDSRSKKYVAEAIWVKERRHLKKEKAKLVEAWLLNSQFSRRI